MLVVLLRLYFAGYPFPWRPSGNNLPDHFLNYGTYSRSWNHRRSDLDIRGRALPRSPLRAKLENRKAAAGCTRLLCDINRCLRKPWTHRWWVQLRVPLSIPSLATRVTGVGARTSSCRLVPVETDLRVLEPGPPFKRPETSKGPYVTVFGTSTPLLLARESLLLIIPASPIKLGVALRPRRRPTGVNIIRSAVPARNLRPVLPLPALQTPLDRRHRASTYDPGE